MTLGWGLHRSFMGLVLTHYKEASQMLLYEVTSFTDIINI